MSDDEEDTHCPLCVEEMDDSDKNFIPCPCGYRVCMWCWHHIREAMNGLCPACRSPYNEDPHAFSAVDRQEIVRRNRERKQKEKQEKKVTDRPAISKPVVQSLADRRHLHNYRVVQRNLVYVIGLPAVLSSEDLLRKAEYFGQYGKIGKVVIHRNHSATHATISAYVTFAYKEDAKASIQSLEGHWVDGHLLRASFGTTKYCNNFIRGMPCNNPDCVYLHELGEDEDRFTKEEIQAGHSKLVHVPGSHQTIVTGNGGPSGTGKRCTSEPFLPPPVFLQDIVPGTGPGNSPRAAAAIAAAGKTPGEGSAPLGTHPVTGILQFKTAVEQGRSSSPQSSPSTPSNTLMIPPDSPPFDPLPTPLLPPLLPPIAAINTSISTLTSASISVPSPKKGIKSNTNTNTNTNTKDGKDKDVKEKDLNYTKDKDKDNIKEKESDVNEKESKDFNGEEIYGKDASGITKELMTRQDKINEAFRIRAAAITSSSTPSSAISSSASLSTSASLSATATSMLIPLGMESDGSGVSTPTKSNIGSRSPNLGPASNTSKLSNTSNASNVATASEGEVEFKEVRKMPVLVKETSPTSMSPVNTVNTVKMHGVISSNSLGPVMMDSAMQLTPNGLPSAPPGVLMPSIDTTAVIRMARSQSYNEGIAGLQPNINPGKSEALQQQAAAAAFNGLGRCAVFPVPVSSLAISVWSAILNSSSSDLLVNPFGKLLLPISELLDLTLPPVDAVFMNPWPKPLGYYMQGVGPDGTSHAPAAKHVHRTANSNAAMKSMNSPLQSQGNPMQQTNDIKDRDRERDRERAQRDFFLSQNNAQNQNQNQNQNNLNLNQNMGLNQLLNLNLNQNQSSNGMQMSSTSSSSSASTVPSPINSSNGQAGGGQGQTLNQISHNLTLGGNSLTPSQLQQQHQQLLFQQQQQVQRQNHDRQYELQQQQQHELIILRRNEETNQSKVTVSDRTPATSQGGTPGISILQQMFPTVKMSFGVPPSQPFQQPTQPRR